MTPLIQISVAGVDAWLVRPVPVGEGSAGKWFSADFSLPLSLDAGLTNREARVPLGSRFNLHGTYQIVLRGQTELAQWRQARQSMGASRLVIPFWPACATTQLVTSAWWADVTLSSAAVTVYDAEHCPESVASTHVLVPLLLASFAKAPTEKRLDADNLLLTLDWQSDGEATWLAAPAGSWTNGPATAAGATTVWPIRADWSTTPTGFDAVMPFDLHQYGPRRERAVEAFEQPALRSFEQAMTLRGPGWLSLLAFVAEQHGAAFWIDGGTTEARLTAAAASADTHLTLNDATTLGAQRAMVLDDGRNRRVVLATSTAVNPVPLSAAVSQDFASGAAVRAAALVRLAQRDVSLVWASPELATATCRFIELGWELLTPEGETTGHTLGRLPQAATLFEVKIGAETWRYTNYERPLSDGAHTWDTAHLEHGDIAEKINLEEISVTITGRWLAGSPFARLWPMTLEAPLFVRIIEATLDADGLIDDTVTLFRGELVDPDLQGSQMTLKCGALASLLDRSIPATTVQTKCRWTFCQGGCGAVRSDHEVTAVVVAGITAATTLTVQSGGVAWTGGTFPAHRFANGELNQTAPLPTCLIADSTVPDGGGVMTLTLSVPMTLALGATVKLLPGCDGDFATCTGYSQTATFGGAPWIPPRNLLEFQPTSTASASGKK